MKRDYRLDLIRVISMTLVIVIHVANIYNRNINNIEFSSYTYAALYNAIARISVPLFFMISGALLIPREDSKDKYVNRIKSMIVTLFSWTVIYLIWDTFILNKTYTSLKVFIQSLFIPIKANLWFMYAIIGIYMVLPFIRKMFKDTTFEEEKLFLYLWSFFAGIVYIIILISRSIKIPLNITNPVRMIQEAYYLGYFILGHVLYKRNEEINIKSKYLFIIFIVNIILIFIPTLLISYYSNSYYQSLFGYRSIFYILASASFMLLMLRKELSKITIKILNKISPYSFGIYFVHAMFINLLNRTDLYKLHGSFAVPLYSLILFIISYIVVYLLRKIPPFKKIT